MNANTVGDGVVQSRSDDNDVICTAYGWLEDQEEQFFYNGIRALEKCWTKHISVAGVYVEVTKYDVCIS